MGKILYNLVAMLWLTVMSVMLIAVATKVGVVTVIGSALYLIAVWAFAIYHVYKDLI